MIARYLDLLANQVPVDPLARPQPRQSLFPLIIITFSSLARAAVLPSRTCYSILDYRLIFHIHLGSSCLRLLQEVIKLAICLSASCKQRQPLPSPFWIIMSDSKAGEGAQPLDDGKTAAGVPASTARPSLSSDELQFEILRSFDRLRDQRNRYRDQRKDQEKKERDLREENERLRDTLARKTDEIQRLNDALTNIEKQRAQEEQSHRRVLMKRANDIKASIKVAWGLSECLSKWMAYKSDIIGQETKRKYEEIGRDMEVLKQTLHDLSVQVDNDNHTVPKKRRIAEEVNSENSGEKAVNESISAKKLCTTTASRQTSSSQRREDVA
ncbi:hypothetical protein GGR56DRAFT_485598 [Xylariaceae sp. FL0804]|nr:hypothetical protein GGR56DRAFT_485598 [Xylariaceae sp. FL0804]